MHTLQMRLMTVIQSPIMWVPQSEFGSISIHNIYIYIYAYRGIQKVCVRVSYICTVVFTGKYLNYKVPRHSDRAIGSHKVSNKSTWLIRGGNNNHDHMNTRHNNSTKQWREKAMWTWKESWEKKKRLSITKEFWTLAAIEKKRNN